MSGVFDKVPAELDFPKEEKEILRFWKERRIFEKSLELRKNGKPFVFYEGPPTANGLPHNGHVLTRVMKDIFPRYKTMRGYHVGRKAGWDTHGLPVEVEVEKELRIHGKAAIEAYGVEPFIARCIDSVFRYTKEWETLTERIGFWVDLGDAYVTYHKSYVESVWWALSELFRKGLLYQGHKVVWWWAQGGTALSAAEVGQGYKQVADPSVFVRFPLRGEPGISLVAWTTTPWTLPSNMYAAVKADVDYVVVEHDVGRLIIAAALREAIAKKLKSDLPVVGTRKGAELVGLEYEPPFDDYARAAPREKRAWRVVAADFVTLDSGTGIVHIAPAFGVDDYEVFKREIAAARWPRDEGPLCAIEADGTFGRFFGDAHGLTGTWVKDADKPLIEKLRARGLLLHKEDYVHDYPFCPRADQDPLIQFARPAWYIRTTQEIDKAIANNQAVSWLPPHIKDGRMGDFLRNNVDWALSRERWWGTPLNVWVCERDAEHKHAPTSVDEIRQLNPSAFSDFEAAKANDPSLNEHLIVHKPWIDKATFPCRTCGATMRRVPEVIDCWFDSGCMPFAQWGFPHAPGSVERFARNFPANFISEAIDQTRGWFYSLLMISTLVFDEETQKRFGLAPARGYPHPYETCIVLGHVCDKEGKKESKSKGNYTPPEIVFERVSMEFAVVDVADTKLAVKRPGLAYIAQEDLEGLDIQVKGAPEYGVPTVGIATVGDLEIRVHGTKGLPRRVLALHAEDIAALGKRKTSKKDVKPAEVGRLPAEERVVLSDPTQPAPGSDAFRWFFYASSPPWSNTRHALSNVRALQKEFLIKLRNVYGFFVIYANIDGFDPARHGAGTPAYSELDRWIRSELHATIEGITEDLDAYQAYEATQKLSAFVDALSNWYVRRSRDRFWRAVPKEGLAGDADKLAAYLTLYECLSTLAALIAPFVPFLAEQIFGNLVARRVPGAPESVHLMDWPAADRSAIDAALSEKMGAVRELVSLGLSVRTQARLKVRQPLRSAKVILANAAMEGAVSQMRELVAEELNVLSVDFVSQEHAQAFAEAKLKPNFRTLGQRGLGKEAQAIKTTLAALSPEAAFSKWLELQRTGAVEVGGVRLSPDDLEVAFTSKEGFAAASDRVGLVVLDTTLDDELRELGLKRELQNRLQGLRKELRLEFTDRIYVVVLDATPGVRSVIEKHRAELEQELLAQFLPREKAVVFGRFGAPQDHTVDLDGEQVTVRIMRAD
jgi:isoleucyl-tRNA synthetase